MPFVAIDHTIAFAIDAPAKASDMQQLDQNVDDHESRLIVVEVNTVTNGDSHDHIGGDGAQITLSALKFTQGSYYNASILISSSVYVATDEYVHAGVVGSSNTSPVYWGWSGGSAAAGMNTTGEVNRLHGYNSNASNPAAGQITWRYHSN